MAEPVTLAEAKLHLRLGSSTSEDVLIGDLIVAAREWVEGYTGHLLVRREVAQEFAGFGAYLDLRAWPIASVDSVTYLDSAGIAQTLDVSAYSAMYGQRPARVISPRWPASTGPVTVTVTAGYADSEVPKLFKQAVKVAVAGFYMHRDGLPEEVVRKIAAVLRSKRRWTV